MRFPKAMLGAFALALAAGSIAVAQQGDKMVTAELFASLPQSVGNITFTPDHRVIYSHHPFFAPEVRVAELNPKRLWQRRDIENYRAALALLGRKPR
jgi:hypothetical protein